MEGKQNVTHEIERRAQRISIQGIGRIGSIEKRDMWMSWWAHRRAYGTTISILQHDEPGAESWAGIPNECFDG
ncbi:MAG: hypothetical protein CMF59_12475 [Leptospiraceae bacterium]|nr:hypothetical protein [Leptospiraceae bacterium]